MRLTLDARLDALPPAQQKIWPALAPAARLSFVLYGGTAVALHLGHRQSEDFDFFRHEPLDRQELERSFPFLLRSMRLQDEPDTLVVSTETALGPVKLSFFGRIRFGTVHPPLVTRDRTLLVASRDDVLVTKLRAILARAEAKDYADIAALLGAGCSLAAALSAFRQMFGGEPATVLRAIGYFEDGDVGAITDRDKKILRDARDTVGDLPPAAITRGSLSRT